MIYSTEPKRGQKSIYDYFKETGTDAGYKGLLERPMIEIDEKTWWYFLEVLPPGAWNTRLGINMFYIIEEMTDGIVSQYGRTMNTEGKRRYFHKYVRKGETDTWMTPQDIANMDAGG